MAVRAAPPTSIASLQAKAPDLPRLLAAARSRSRSMQNAVVAFWGFADPALCDALVDGLRYAFRTRRVFCSDDDRHRFEGMLCMPTDKVAAFEALTDALGMGVGSTELFTFRAGSCLSCLVSTPATFTCLRRIETGQRPRGTHMREWGAHFERLVARYQEEDTVKTVTGMSLTSHNMIMLHMAQRASEQSVRHAHSRALALQREHDHVHWLRTRTELLQNENQRMLFEIQRAYRLNALTTEAFHSIIFSPR
jgi:hypothetical protein